MPPPSLPVGSIITKDVVVRDLRPKPITQPVPPPLPSTNRVRHGTHKRRQNIRNHNYVPYPPPNCLLIEALNTDLQEPKSFKQAIVDDKWVSAMKEEINALHEDGTLVLMNKPSDCNKIGSH